MISLKMIGAKETAKRLSSPQIHSVMDRNFNKGAMVLKAAIQEEAPVKSGKLKKSIRLQKKGLYSWMIVEGMPYGKMVREGTIAHSIYPVKAKALWWPGLPHPIAWTPHPGIRRPNDYVGRGEARAAPELQRLSEDFGREIVTALGG